MTIGEFVKYFEAELAPLQWYDRREVRSMASYLLKEIAGVERYKLIVEPQMELSGDCEADLIGCVHKMKQGEPLQYVLGYEYFCGHKFKVAPGVLIPRPETEELVNMILADSPSLNLSAESGENENGSLRVLDICAGSGCIAWSLAAGLPGSKVWGCDISEEALEIARSQKISSASEVSFFKCDVLDSLAEETIIGASGGGCFDIIVSNPPYVCDAERSQMRPNVLDYEPDLALFVPDDDPLKFYGRIVELSGGEKGLLRRGGMLYFEVNERFALETSALMQSAGFVECRIICDMFGKERMVKGRKER